MDENQATFYENLDWVVSVEDDLWTCCHLTDCFDISNKSCLNCNKSNQELIRGDSQVDQLATSESGAQQTANLNGQLNMGMNCWIIGLISNIGASKTHIARSYFQVFKLAQNYLRSKRV